MGKIQLHYYENNDIYIYKNCWKRDKIDLSDKEKNNIP